MTQLDLHETVVVVVAAAAAAAEVATALVSLSALEAVVAAKVT